MCGFLVLFCFLSVNLEYYNKSERAAGDWSEGQEGGPAHRRRRLRTVWLHRSPKQLRSGGSHLPGCCVPASTCAPKPGYPRARCPGLLNAESTGGEGWVQTDAQWLGRENRESARGKGEGSRQTLKLALRKQRQATDAQRWRPLPGWPPGSFPRACRPCTSSGTRTRSWTNAAERKGPVLETGSGNTCSLLRPWGLSLLPQLRQKFQGASEFKNRFSPPPYLQRN